MEKREQYVCGLGLLAWCSTPHGPGRLLDATTHAVFFPGGPCGRTPCLEYDEGHTAVQQPCCDRKASRPCPNHNHEAFGTPEGFVCILQVRRGVLGLTNGRRDVIARREVPRRDDHGNRNQSLRFLHLTGEQAAAAERAGRSSPFHGPRRCPLSKRQRWVRSTAFSPIFDRGVLHPERSHD